MGSVVLVDMLSSSLIFSFGFARAGRTAAVEDSMGKLNVFLLCWLRALLTRGYQGTRPQGVFTDQSVRFYDDSPIGLAYSSCSITINEPHMMPI